MKALEIQNKLALYSGLIIRERGKYEFRLDRRGPVERGRMKKTKTDWGNIGFVLLMLFLIGLAAGSIYMAATANARCERNCIAFSEKINRPTQYRNGACYVEICEGYWVREEDVIYSLDVCEGEE